MQSEFIDLEGASGAAYRFRRWPATGNHPPIAGNFAVIDAAGTPLRIGVTNDLSTVAVADLASGQLFTRLNVSRATREAEHEDLVQRYPGAAAAA
jgi:hypothetical protein